MSKLKKILENRAATKWRRYFSQKESDSLLNEKSNTQTVYVSNAGSVHFCGSNFPSYEETDLSLEKILQMTVVTRVHNLMQ